ncbi:hypothetical protein B0H14DRAFT_2519288 [Mycena olivaceomarginata]|nr:hypothetical protein B0H14DRAFT_2519288 [Mycena olivaceomarginata]
MPQELDLLLTALAAVFVVHCYYSVTDTPPPSPHLADYPPTHDSPKRAYVAEEPGTSQTRTFDTLSTEGVCIEGMPGTYSHTPAFEEPSRAYYEATEDTGFSDEASVLWDHSQTVECGGCPREISASGLKCPGSGCTEVYCSQSCLGKSADGHARYCTNPYRALTTADTLATATFRDMFPDDPRTNEDFFFNRIRTPHDKTHLFGLYIGILKYLEVNPSTLHEWRLSGTMVTNIKALYEPIPIGSRGGYYSWFLKHLDIFDPPPNALGEGQVLKEMRAAQVKLWNTIGDFPSQDHDEIWSFVSTHWSRERVHFFLFRSMSGICHPSPEFDFWVDFGFCACHDESEEQFLSFTYGMLIRGCSYNEFLKAYTDSTIIQLLDAKGLRGRRIIHPYLEDVLSGPPVKSVWDLKKHVHAKSIRSDLIPTVAVDYGFMNCTSDREYQDLRDLYKNIFERRYTNPLELHEACVSGSLYDYVLGLFPEMKEKKKRAAKFQRLLRNPYPLPEFD